MTATPRSGTEEADEQSRNAIIVEEMVRRLQLAQVLPALPTGPEDFQRVSQLVSACFLVDETAITTRMARLLFAISGRVQPRSVLVVGSYQANALIWLAAGAPATARIVGVDIDDKANKRARQNCEAVALREIEFACVDGHNASALFDAPIDLVLLDADHPTRGKTIYLSLAQALVPAIAPGGVLLAHDVCWPKFKDDLVGFTAFVQDPGYFSATRVCAIDRYGLSISRKAT